MTASSKKLDSLDVFAIIQKAIKAAGSQRKFAEQCGITPQQLNNGLNGIRNIPEAVLRHLKIKRVMYFVQEGE